MPAVSKKASRRLSQLARIISRDGPDCVWCSSELGLHHDQATIEHVIPQSVGGANVFENMLLACGQCNSSRQSTPVAEWLRQCALTGRQAQGTVVTAGLLRAETICNIRPVAAAIA